MILVFLWSVVISSISDSESSLFFSWWVCLKVYRFYLFKESALSFMDLLYHFLSLYFIHFCSNCFSLPSTTFGLCAVPSSLRYKGRLFKSFMFLEVGIYYYELPSRNCFYSIPQISISYIPILICLKVFLNFFFDFFFNLLLFRSMLLNLHI